MTESRVTRRPRRGRRGLTAVAFGSLPLLLASCAGTGAALPEADDRFQVVTTTGIIRDLVEHVGGDHVEVHSLVPDGADPHSYEPTLRNIRDVVYADAAFSNYAFLEQHSIVTALDANLRDGVPNIALAEESAAHGAELIQLVENAKLDTIWLGMRIHGDGAPYGADRSSEAHIVTRNVTGPGNAFAYLTGTFGEAHIALNSSDGFDASKGYEHDRASLPIGAHTHMSWVFTQPGIYTLDLAADVQASRTDRPIPVGEGKLTFAVGVDPSTVGRPDATVLKAGHADVTADLDTKSITVRHDASGMGDKQESYRAEDVIIEVPSKAISEIPGDPRFRFLGEPGTQVYQLAQAVLGAHIHGEIDPHLWHDVKNTMAYVEVIRDTLMSADPSHAASYATNADAYLAELETLDTEMQDAINSIPEPRRHLVTTHDSFAYLAKAYGMDVAGFITPNPAVEVSLADRRRLQQTIEQLEVPAVFLEPNLARRANTLTEIADAAGIRVCPIYSDVLDSRVTSYTDLMRFNATSLRDCLAGS